MVPKLKEKDPMRDLELLDFETSKEKTESRNEDGLGDRCIGTTP